MEPRPVPDRIPPNQRFRELQTQLDIGLTTDLKALDNYLRLGAKVFREGATRYAGKYHEEIALTGLMYYQASQGTYRKEKKEFCAGMSRTFSDMAEVYTMEGNNEVAADYRNKAGNWQRLADICEQIPENNAS